MIAIRSLGSWCGRRLFFNTEDAESAEKCGSERAGKKERENRELRCGSGFEEASQLVLVFGEVEVAEAVLDEAGFAEEPFFVADDVDFFYWCRR